MELPHHVHMQLAAIVACSANLLMAKVADGVCEHLWPRSLRRFAKNRVQDDTNASNAKLSRFR